MTGLLEQGSRQGQEESGQQKHQWTKQRLCVTYEISLETRLARQGLGLSHFQQWSKISAAERRTMDQAEVRRTEDDQRKARAIELGKQGVWIKWNM